MIILIVVGAVIIFVAWTSARKRRQDDDERKDAEESTEKFKKDLEKTANEIIGRMESQAAHLEKLLSDSEHIRTQIEGRIAEIKKLIRKSENQSIELKELLARLDDTVEEINLLQRQAAVKNPARPATKSPMPSPKMLITPQPVTPPQNENFAKVLESSLNEKPAPKRSEQLTQGNDSDSSDFDNGDSAAVREMLRSGMTVEEIARETGMGRGAILLVQQMMRRSKS